MASPFPGMDPHLEEPIQWQSFHNAFVNNAARALNAALPRRYVARIEERCVIAETGLEIRPDAALGLYVNPGAAHGGTATMQPRSADAPVILQAAPVEDRENYVNVLDLHSGRIVVATLELISPTNKAPGKGRRAYLRKQQSVLTSHTHLIEIDLLRQGEHVLAVPLPLLQRRPRWDYLACLHRARQGARYEIWPCTTRQTLPCITVPLAGEDADVALDLQAVFTTTYDDGAYDRDTDYTQDAVPRLRPEDTAWADTLLRERGLRT